MDHSLLSPESVARFELANGITLMVRENDASPSVALGGYLWAGALSEPREKAGLAGFTAGMLARGTERHTFSQINDMLESVGAQLGFQAGVHTVGFWGKALAEDLGLLLDMLADDLQRPVFPAGEMERLRGQILTGLKRRGHDTRAMADLTFDELLYGGDHPYGRSVQGYEDTVSGLTRDDLVEHYRRRCSPQSMVMVIIGAVSAQEIHDRVQTALGEWRAGEALPNRSIPPTVKIEEQQRRLVDIPGKTQTDIVLGWPGLTRNDPDYMAAKLANTILGVFGIMGRLGDSVRDQQGLAYYVYSQLEAGLGTGSWRAIAGVDPAQVEHTVDCILHEVRRLREEPVHPADLADCQAYLTGSMPLRLETNEGVAGALLDIERYNLGLDYLQRYAGLVNAVTVREIQEVAQRYLDLERYALAIAGS